MRTKDAVFFSLAVLSVAGCGGGSHGPVVPHPVNGQVIYDGKPADGVQVFFFPISAPAVPQIPSNPHGVTKADGRFTLTTFKEGDGAAEGGYNVILLWPPASKSDHDEETDGDRLLGWYDAAHTQLTVRVEAKENTFPPFRLARVSTPPGLSEGIPGRN